MDSRSRQNSPTVLRVALLFHASKVYDREIITGIGDYVNQTRVAWDLFLEEDYRFRLDGIHDWEGDGIIADYDDPSVAQALTGLPRSSLEMYFRRELKRSVHDEILRHKLHRCFELLSDTQMGIAEVARACGFRCVQYLNTVFKRELGATPAAWRLRVSSQLLL